MRQIGKRGEAFLSGRGIDVSVAENRGVFSCSWDTEFGDYVPDIEGDVLGFPHIRDGRAVGCQYRRTSEKKFTMQPGSQPAFFNGDVLSTKPETVYITEGQLDALVLMTVGIENVISVPNGTPGQLSSGVSTPEEEENGSFAYLYKVRKKFNIVKNVVLALDNDRPGKVLEQELIRRIGPGKCSIVQWPSGCKDANDTLKAGGHEAVAAAIKSAKPVPLRGIYRLSDYPEWEEPKPIYTGFSSLDPVMRFFCGGFFVFIGSAGLGKSTFLCNLLINVSHKMPVAMASPEMMVKPFLVRKLQRMYCRGNYSLRDEAIRHIEKRFLFIDTPPDEHGAVSFEELMTSVEDCFMRTGCKFYVLDPWSAFEHAWRRGETSHEYSSRVTREMSRLARDLGICIIVSVHPPKSAAVTKDGTLMKPSLYAAADSASWANRADGVYSVFVEDFQVPISEITAHKVRHAPLMGSRGMVKIGFDPVSETYRDLDQEDQSPF